jgi:2,3-bisphosphoglycerate-dependent phosphoglycerate mutase
MEDLRERHFSDDMIADEEFEPASKKMFDDPDYALPGGESNTVCQNRAVGVLKQILEEYKGKKSGDRHTRTCNDVDDELL